MLGKNPIGEEPKILDYLKGTLETMIAGLNPSRLFPLLGLAAAIALGVLVSASVANAQATFAVLLYRKGRRRIRSHGQPDLRPRWYTLRDDRRRRFRTLLHRSQRDGVPDSPRRQRLHGPA